MLWHGLFIGHFPHCIRAATQEIMAKAYFINATTYEMSVNLNAAPKNHIIAPFQIASADPGTVAEFQTWPANIEAFAGRNRFGGNSHINAVTVFLSSHTAPLVFNVMSAVPVALDLYFYIQDGTIIGVDMTGESSAITIQPWTQGVASAMRLQSLGARSIKQWRD